MAQLNAFRHVDVVKTTCKFKVLLSGIGIGKKADLSDWTLVVGGVSQTADLLGFHSRL